MNDSIAIVGAGESGLVAAKNLIEVGFKNVTIFEKRDAIGGLWAYTEDPNVPTVLKSTRMTISKYRTCFTDFPFPDDAYSFPTSQQCLQYLHDYAQHFDLLRLIQFNIAVTGISRDKTRNKWKLDFADNTGRTKTQSFDRVVICNGLYTVPIVPKFLNQELFKGEFIHSQQFKDPRKYKGKRVLIVGFGNSAADIADSLIGYAEKITISHRSGAFVLPRRYKGQPFDRSINYRATLIRQFIGSYFPWLARKLLDFIIKKIMLESFKVDPAWRLFPTRPVMYYAPPISGTILPNIAAGKVDVVHGLKRIISEDTLELMDSSKVKADVVILCTGLIPNFFLQPDTASKVPQDESPTSVKDSPLPKLYQRILTLDYPMSLSYIGYLYIPEGSMCLIDLETMALAQIWAGNYQLPSKGEMTREVDDNEKWFRQVSEKLQVLPMATRESLWYDWVHKAAGTGMPSKLGFGLKAWLFWLQNPKFCNMLMGGIPSAHVYRLFETGRRKSWSGAKEAIIKANKQSETYYGTPEEM